MAEMETQHHLVFETYREGTLPMGQYLEFVAFPVGAFLNPGVVSSLHVGTIEALFRKNELIP